MTKNNYKIISEDNISTVLNRLKEITIEKQPFIKPKGMFFLGKINNSSFNLMTFNSPPANLKFKINNNQLEFVLKNDSMEKTYKTLIYILLYPILGILWFLSLISDNYGLTERIILTIVLIIPIPVQKIWVWFYKNNFLANEEKILIILEEILKVKINKIQQPIEV